MSDLEDWSPAEVLRAKRLEIVDDEGKVRAASGTGRESRAYPSFTRAAGYGSAGGQRLHLPAGSRLRRDAALAGE